MGIDPFSFDLVSARVRRDARTGTAPSEAASNPPAQAAGTTKHIKFFESRPAIRIATER